MATTRKAKRTKKTPRRLSRPPVRGNGRTAETALITGASSGNGQELARVFAVNGFDLVLVARRRAALEALARELRVKHGCRAVAMTCDLHGNVTRRMVENLDVLVGYRHYPHDDTRDTGRRATELLLRAAAGEVRPVIVQAKLPLILTAFNSTTLTDSDAAFPVGMDGEIGLRGLYVSINNGSGFLQDPRLITANTAGLLL